MYLIMKTIPNITVTYEAGFYTANISWNDNEVIADGETLDAVIKDIEKWLKHHLEQTNEQVQLEINIPSILFVFNPSHASHLQAS